MELEEGDIDLAIYERRIGNLIRFAPHIRQVILLRGDDVLFNSNMRSRTKIDLERLRFSDEPFNVLSLGIQIGDTIDGRFLPEMGDVASKSSPRRLIPLLLSLNNTSPEAAYRVLVGMNAHYMDRLFNTTDLGYRDSYALLRADGTVLLSKGRESTSLNAIQKAISSFKEGRDESHLREQEGWLVKSKTTIRFSSKYPLGIVVSVDHGATFSNWLEENKILILSLLLATFGILVIAFWLYLDLQRSKILRKEIRLLSSAVQQSPVSFLITDKQGVIHYANPAFERIYGYSREEYIGQRPSIIKSGMAPEGVYQNLWASINRGETWQGEFINRTKDGQLIPTSTAISPVVDDDGSFDYLVGALMDISEQKELQERALAASHEARLASEAKSHFLATMSHELRTPMTGIKGIIELLKSNQCNPQQVADLLDDLGSSSNALMMLLNDILDLSKIEAGKLQIEILPCNSSAIIENVLHLFKETAQAKGVELTSNAQDYSDIWVKSDGLRLRQIVSNLVSNAVKFTETGHVRVNMRVTPLVPGKVSLNIAVEDTGIGMTPEQVDSAFEPFTQADASTTRKYGGTGLGLTITKQLCQLLGGRLKINSELNSGSTFSVDIPVDQVHAPNNNPSRKMDIGSLQMLLAEDNVVNQKVVSALLRQKGHMVDIVSNGQEAVDIAQKKKFDIILMDMQMPVMDGVEAILHIRKDQNLNCNTVIFAFTADAFPEHRGKYLEAGANDVVTKPLNWSQLYTKLTETFQVRK
ncbi:MAG: ATP-binding protein [Terasakiella sp.]|uniref:PAS domain-containing hybrid sensor histidine kinase/response regulator n=1 Tax=unclassified Terasakiella TaxID=2614952 RepID=UPI003AFF7F39